jgi:hypothetical protein
MKTHPWTRKMTDGHHTYKEGVTPLYQTPTYRKDRAHQAYERKKWRKFLIEVMNQ